MKIFKKSTLKKKFYFLLITLFLNSCSISKKIELVKKGNVENKEYVTEIPFRYINNHIFIDVKINNKTYNFLFDTGAEFNVIDEDIFKELQYKTISKGKASGNSFSTQKVKSIEIPKISLSNVDFVNTSAIVLNLPFKKHYGCFEVNGIIGNNLMRKANWQIDYKNKVIRITDDLKNVKISEKAVPIKMNAKTAGNIYLDIGINGVFSKFTFDTGSNWSITTSSKKFQSFQDKNKKLEFLKRGNEYEFIADIVSLGKINIEKQIITLENGNHSLLGNRFFENYTLTIDWKKDVIFFDSVNQIKESKLSSYQLGLTINYEKNIIVANNSWLEHKLDFEVENGTKILSINSVNVTNFKRSELCEYWYNFNEQIKDGREIEIELNTRNGKRKVTLNKKQLLPKPFVK